MNETALTEWLKEESSISDVNELLPDEIEINQILANGGQGIVYRGTISNIDAAVKVYFPGQVQLRIDREIDALSSLDNSHIVDLLWSGNVSIDDFQLPTVVTELIPGIDLSHQLELKALNHDEIGMLTFDIADAVGAMWEKRIVHRDLKPPNILRRPDGRSCVIDLGVARHIDLTPLTATGFTWGTQGYMSPEQTKAARQLTCKSDIFALGVILVECALGRHPTRRDQLRLFASQLHEQLPPEISTWQHVSLLKAMLNPKPPKRPLPQVILTTLKEFAP